MSWTIERATEEATWTEDYLRTVLATALPKLPAHRQKIGASTVRWWEGAPGHAVIMAEGGSVEDRTLAEQVTKTQLAFFGYKRQAFLIDGTEELRKTADWDDIAEKAKRLVDSGNVTLLRNGYNNVVAHVIGDHGEYNCEIGRDDPNSRTITTWTCECPWDQYAWQRTRKWRKYEGRPCAHVMAALWQSMKTPLDEQLSEEQAQGMGTGQAIGPGAGSPLPSGPGAQAPAGLPRSFSPEGDIIQGDQTQMPMESPPPAAGGAPMAPPGAPGVLPPFPGEQMQMEMQPPAPGQTPGGMDSPPGSVSIPGAKLPSPFNPIQFPGGTYSRVSADQFTNGQIVRLKNNVHGTAEGKSEAHGAGQYRMVPEGSSGEVLGQDPTTGWVDCIFPLDDSGPMEPFHVRCWLEPSDLIPSQMRPPGPFIRRR